MPSCRLARPPVVPVQSRPGGCGQALHAAAEKKVKKRKSGAIQPHYLSIFRIRNNVGSSSLDVDGTGGGEPASCTVIVTHCADEAHKDRVAH